MPRRRSIRAYCPRCRHSQPFIRARIRWALHIAMTVCTLGLWAVSFIAAFIRQKLWPWRCEHCGWHEPDVRSPAERKAAMDGEA